MIPAPEEAETQRGMDTAKRSGHRVECAGGLAYALHGAKGPDKSGYRTGDLIKRTSLRLTCDPHENRKRYMYGGRRGGGGEAGEVRDGIYIYIKREREREGGGGGGEEEKKKKRKKNPEQGCSRAPLKQLQ